MKKDFGSKPWFVPLPVLIIGTYNEDGTPDAMNAAWGGLYDSRHVVLCLSGGRRTTHNIQNRKAFTVSFADAAHVKQADYVGLVSANDVPDKLARAGWRTTPSAYVDAPLIDALPMALECRLVKVNEDGNIIGEIVNVCAEERVLDEQGVIDTEKLEAICFDPMQSAYRKLGQRVGTAFADGNALR